MVGTFSGFFNGKKVLITGHTGFKGSWLSLWLLKLGADVIGYSVDIPTRPSNFEVLVLQKKIKHIQGDIRDFKKLNSTFKKFIPRVVFHLAAQPVTKVSYDFPQDTFDINLMGSVNILECVRQSKSVKAAVMITSDKCYQNVEWVWGYRENDKLGGDDPYSASKACAEISAHAYIKSFFLKNNYPRVATARAGNVIGGGDWALHRIIPDCARAFSKGSLLEIRSPNATRPWQHVLEPLSGYLHLAQKLLIENSLNGESFNFGPYESFDITVGELVDNFVRELGGACKISHGGNDKKNKECTYLKLNCDKAARYLNWRSVLSFNQAVSFTASWYKKFYSKRYDMFDYSLGQIEEYVALAKKAGLAWAR